MDKYKVGQYFDDHLEYIIARGLTFEEAKDVVIEQDHFHREKPYTKFHIIKEATDEQGT